MKKLFLIGLMFVGVQVSAQQNCESAKKKYLQMNPDVATSNIDAWEHYIQYGKKEGRVWYECVGDLKTEPKLPDGIEKGLSITYNEIGELIFITKKKSIYDDIEKIKEDIGANYRLYNASAPEIKRVRRKWIITFKKR